MKKILPCLLLCLLALSADGQGFTLQGTTPQGVTGIAVLTLYPADGQSIVTKQRVRKGSFSFAGTLKEPTVAMLRVANDAPLYLWVENTDMSIAYNPASPSASRVNGSRSNSEYRYALEQCGQQAAGRESSKALSQALIDYASQHLSARYVPFLLWLHYQGEDYAAVDSVCRHLSGPAAHAFHYPLLQRQVVAMRQSAEGCKVPSVRLPMLHGKEASLDSLRRTAAYTFLLISPTWIEQHQHMADSLHAAIHLSGRQAQVAWAVQDKASAPWDAPYMQQLNVRRIPYIILIDSTGRILVRDVRVWEALRLLQALPPTAPPTGKTLPAVVPAAPPQSAKPAPQAATTH